MPHLRIEDPRSANAAALSVALRQRLGIGRPQLARWLGVTRQYVSKLEGGMTPSKPVLYLMMRLDEESRQTPHPDRDGAPRDRSLPDSRLPLPQSAIGLLDSWQQEHPLTGREGLSVTAHVNDGIGAHPGDITVTANYPRIPLLTMNEAAELTEIAKVGVAARQTLPFPAMDSHSFAVRVAGEAMWPRCVEGDVAIVYPSLEPRNGDLVFARPSDEKGGGLLLRLYHLTEDAGTMMLTSYHASCPTVSLSRRDCQWLVPVVALVRQFR